MDITLRNVKITVVRESVDTILITPDNVKMGAYPFEGNQVFRVDVPTGNAEAWLTENFGEIENIKIVQDR